VFETAGVEGPNRHCWYSKDSNHCVSNVPENLTRLPDNSHAEEKACDCDNQNEDENSSPDDC